MSKFPNIVDDPSNIRDEKLDDFPTLFTPEELDKNLTLLKDWKAPSSSIFGRTQGAMYDILYNPIIQELNRINTKYLSHQDILKAIEESKVLWEIIKPYESHWSKLKPNVGNIEKMWTFLNFSGISRWTVWNWFSGNYWEILLFVSNL
mgnify:FL=1